LADQGHTIAIVGGGLVGASLALALARAEFDVVLFERDAPALDWPADSDDLRVSALSRASQHLLKNLGVWQQMAADRVTPYRDMRVWDRAGVGEIAFDAADLAEPDLGHIVENRVTVRALWRALAAAGVTVRTGVRPAALELSGDGALLSLDDGSRQRAALLVGADGARSQVRELAGIDARSESYEQHAVVATVLADAGNRATAWQHFMPTGPLALLPLGHDRFSIVWSTGPAEAAELCACAPEAFEAELMAASEGRAGTLRLHGPRASFPLRLQHAERYVAPGLALVGDAAHVIHPLAGQGVNLGFLDAAALVDALLAGRASGRAPGQLRDLRVYERSRRGHNTLTQGAMDLFKHLFGSDSSVVGLVRNVGLGMAGRIPPLRRQFERVALGYGVELPALCRAPGDVGRETA
jgi:2-octaprenylphenol hydroxylase